MHNKYIIYIYHFLKHTHIRPEIDIDIDFRSWSLTANLNGKDQTFAIAPVGEAAQELVVAGGLEAWVKAQTAG
eukprot:1372513-Amorphochlora_amoeboformis.AAC.1